MTDAVDPFGREAVMAKACPLCGDTELRQLYPGYDELMLHNPDGTLEVREGEHVSAPHDYMGCDMCGSFMPVSVWLGRLPTPAERRSYRAYALSGVEPWS